MHNSGWMLTGLYPGGIDAGEIGGRIPRAAVEEGEIALGHDGRVSSRALLRGLTGDEPGGPMTLAALSAAVKSGGFGGGVYLSGAWMPQEFAGAALLNTEGQPLAWSAAGGSSPEYAALSSTEAANPWLKGIRERIDLERAALIPRSFVFDFMYTPGSELIEELLTELPGHLKVLPFREYEPDARETITPCPWRGAPLEQARKIDKNDAEAGFIFGGGSGLRHLSNNGQPVSEGALAALLLLDLIRFREFKGRLIRHAAAPRIVDKAAQKLGVEIEECFGEIELSQRVAASDALLGVLPGGRFVFPGPSPVPDSLQAALALLELNSHTDLPPHLVLTEHLPEALEGGHAVSGLPLAPGSYGAEALAGSASALIDQGLEELHSDGALAVFSRGEERLSLAITLDGCAIEIRADAADDASANKLAGQARNVLVRSVL